ncbi:cold-shock protein [Nocardia brasiliensis]|uniref:cold-shock protein n=1 Tax=Nocardia brasiliensis TaxID=37326 RepID=UPI002454CEA4|nr:cold shock domain-containing protein [Nocardia brasiliensis]
MPEGSVKWFNIERGFGFIANDDGSDIYVHYTEVPSNRKNEDGYRYLRPKERVEFEIADGENDRLKAIDIRLIN